MRRFRKIESKCCVFNHNIFHFIVHVIHLPRYQIKAQTKGFLTHYIIRRSGVIVQRARHLYIYFLLLGQRPVTYCEMPGEIRHQHNRIGSFNTQPSAAYVFFFLSADYPFQLINVSLFLS